MAIDQAWLARNLGVGTGVAPSLHLGPTTSVTGVARSIARELIDFDSEGPAGSAFRAGAPLASTGLSRFVTPPWPTSLGPTPGARPVGESLAKADVLIVAWTVDEGHALSRVLTPGFDSQTAWQPYTKNFAAISAQMRPGCPARNAGRLGDLLDDDDRGQAGHPVQVRPAPIAGRPEARGRPRLAPDHRGQPAIVGDHDRDGRGIGPSFEVGDVIVSRFVAFDCRRTFKHLNGQAYVAPADAPSTHFGPAATLFAANAGFLPADNPRPSPQITVAPTASAGILTTDFFGFDNTTDTYGLEGLGDLSEMGDAVLGMVCAELGATAPNYVVVRNVSDPQIEATAQTLAQQAQTAAMIYKGFGRWSSVCSAIVCWAIVAGL